MKKLLPKYQPGGIFKKDEWNSTPTLNTKELDRRSNLPELDDVFWDGTKLVHTNKDGKLTRGQAAALDSAVGSIFLYAPGGDAISTLMGIRDLAYDYSNHIEHPDDKAATVNFFLDLWGMVPNNLVARFIPNKTINNFVRVSSELGDNVSGLGNLVDALYGISGFDLIGYLNDKIDRYINKDNKLSQNTYLQNAKK